MFYWLNLQYLNLYCFHINILELVSAVISLIMLMSSNKNTKYDRLRKKNIRMICAYICWLRLVTLLLDVQVTRRVLCWLSPNLGRPVFLRTPISRQQIPSVVILWIIFLADSGWQLHILYILWNWILQIFQLTGEQIISC